MSIQSTHLIDNASNSLIIFEADDLFSGSNYEERKLECMLWHINTKEIVTHDNVHIGGSKDPPFFAIQTLGKLLHFYLEIAKISGGTVCFFELCKSCKGLFCTMKILLVSILLSENY